MLDLQLNQIESLSKESVDCCRAVGLVSLNDLFDFVKSCRLCTIKDCTPKSVKELSMTIYRYESKMAGFQFDLFSMSFGDDTDDAALSEPQLFMRRVVGEDMQPTVDEAYTVALQSVDDSLKDTFADVYHDGASMLFTIWREPEVTTLYNLNWSVDQNFSFWDFSASFIGAMAQRVGLDNGTSLSSLLKRAAASLDTNLKLSKFRAVYPNLSQIEASVVSDEYEVVLGSLSARARNAIANSQSSLAEVIEIALNPDEAQQRFKYVGSNTINEIAARFLPFCDFVINIKNSPRETLAQVKLQRQLPFLEPQDVTWAEQCRQRLGHLPVFFIIHRYYDNTSDRNDNTFAKISGLKGEPLSRSKMAKTLGVSAERVRQILMNYQPPVSLHAVVCESKNHYSAYNSDFIAAADIFSTIMDDEFEGYLGDKQNVNELSVITSVKMIYGGQIIKYHNKYYWLSDALHEALDIKAAIKHIDDLVTEKRTQPMPLSIQGLIYPYIINHSAVDIERVVDIISKIVSAGMAVSVVQAPCFLMPQNTVAVEQEIYNIISEQGKPMNVKDIQAALAERFPFRDFSRTESIRSYLVRSERITAIGKTSTYGLKKWNINTFTIRDQIFEIINESDRPLSINEIMESLKHKGMARAWTNIYSTIFTDTKRDYARYNGSLFGISSKSYADEFVRMPMKIKKEG